MKNRKLSMFVFFLFIVVLIFSLVYSKTKDNNTKRGDVDVVFSDEPLPKATLVPDNTDITPTPSVTETPVSITEQPSEEISILRDSSLVLTKDNLNEVVLKLFQLDSENVSVLGELPLTESYFVKLCESKSVIPTVSSSSKVVIQKIGLSQDNTFMVIFSTQTSSYYIVGHLQDSQISSIIYKELK